MKKVRERLVVFTLIFCAYSLLNPKALSIVPPWPSKREFLVKCLTPDIKGGKRTERGIINPIQIAVK